MQDKLTLLYQDDDLVVIDKPIGLPVHKSQGMAHDAPYVTKWLGRQLDRSVYNVHRLDAKTSGVLLLALSPETATLLTEQFARREVTKTYHAVVRGTPGEGTFDLKLKKAKHGRKVSALTHYRTLRTVTTGRSHKDEELQLSLLELRPVTGRWHQLRQHCAQGRHDIVGDTQHGDFTLNRLVQAEINDKRLYLHAHRLQFRHPRTEQEVIFESVTPSTFMDLLYRFTG